MVRGAFLNKLKGISLLIIFLFFFGSSTFFSHTHIIDGVTIVHSHPFKHNGNGQPLHTHTSNAYLLIDLLVHFIAVTIAAGLSASFLITTGCEILFSFRSSLKLQSSRTADLYRGPPQLSL